MTVSTASATQLKPSSDRIVLRPNTQDEMTASGTILPDTARQRPQEGEVVAAGPGRYLANGQRLAMEITIVDKIVCSKFAGTEIRVEDEESLVLSTNDILAKDS